MKVKRKEIAHGNLFFVVHPAGARSAIICLILHDKYVNAQNLKFTDISAYHIMNSIKQIMQLIENSKGEK